MHVSLYLLPAVPVATRMLLWPRWRSLMTETLPEEAQERDLRSGSSRHLPVLALQR